MNELHVEINGGGGDGDDVVVDDGVALADYDDDVENNIEVKTFDIVGTSLSKHHLRHGAFELVENCKYYDQSRYLSY